MAKYWDEPKDPDEVLDYECNWGPSPSAAPNVGDVPRLADGDTIVSSEWIGPAGIVIDSDSFDDTTTKIWLSGGTSGENYSFINRITTAGGRTMDQTMKLRVRTK